MYKVTTITFLQEDPAAIKKFQMESRNKWNDHAWRIRNYIISVLTDSPDSSIAGKWVIDNVEELAEIINKHYGSQASSKFSELMRSIVALIAGKLDQIKSGNIPIATEIGNFDVINSLATFLNSINPTYWKREEVASLIQLIFETWINQILARAAGEWEADLKYTDEIHEKILTLADIFSAGIIAQNPGQFTQGEQYVL